MEYNSNIQYIANLLANKAVTNKNVIALTTAINKSNIIAIANKIMSNKAFLVGCNYHN